MYKEKIIHLFSIGAAIVILFSACRAAVPSDNHQENTTNNNVSEKNNGIETNNDVSKSNIIETTIPPTITPTQAFIRL